jgi:hypothetical protein
MTKPFLYVAVMVLQATAAIAPAAAQFHRRRRLPRAGCAPVVTQEKAAPAPSPGIVGNWAGQPAGGSAAPYTFEISITAKGAATKCRTSIALASSRASVGRNPMYTSSKPSSRAKRTKWSLPDDITVTWQGDNLALVG